MPPKNAPTRRTSRTAQEDEERRASRSSVSTAPGSSAAATAPLLLLPAPPAPPAPAPPAPAPPAHVPAAPAPPPPAPAEQEVDDELAALPEWLQTWKRSVQLGYDRPRTPEEAAETARAQEKKRGVTKKSNLARQVERTGRRIPVVWDRNLNGPNANVSTAMVRDLGVWVRRDLPMDHATFDDIPASVLDDLMTHLSVIYDIPSEDIRFRAWLRSKAAESFRSFKSLCAAEYVRNGSAPPHPVEFTHRVGQWRWMMEHFETDTWKTSSAAMKLLRASENKIAHTSRPKPFVIRAHKKVQEGEKGALLLIAAQVLEKNAADKAREIKEQRDRILATEGTSSTPGVGPEDDHDGESSSHEHCDTVPEETQVQVLVKALGKKTGTIQRGLGSGVRLPAKKRGPRPLESSGSASTSTSRASKLPRVEMEKKLEENETQIQSLRSTVSGLANLVKLVLPQELQSDVEQLMRREVWGLATSFPCAPDIPASGDGSRGGGSGDAVDREDDTSEHTHDDTRPSDDASP